MVFKDCWDFAIIDNNYNNTGLLHILMTSHYRLPDVLSFFTSSNNMHNVIILHKPKLSINESSGILHIEGLQYGLVFFPKPVEFDKFLSEDSNFKPLNAFKKSIWKKKLFKRPKSIEVVQGWTVVEFNESLLYERYVSNFDIVLDRGT